MRCVLCKVLVLALSVCFGEIEDLIHILDDNLLESSPYLRRF